MNNSSQDMNNYIFKAGGELSPDHPAFDNTIYHGEGYIDQNFGVDIFEPQVIASPRGTGKTTLANVVYNGHKDYSYNKDINRYRIVVSSDEGAKISQQKLKIMLSEKLQSTEGSSIPSILSSSRILDGKNRSVVIIQNTENLEDDAINWLLSGVKNLIDNPSEPSKLNTQIILDGSVELHQLTAGRNSKFPLRQIYPQEFNYDQLKNFILPRFKELGVEILNPAIGVFWERTKGDKYFTQRICIDIAQSLQSKDERKLNEEFVWKIFDKYISSGAKYDMEKKVILEGLHKIEDYYFKINKESFPWSKIDTFWNDPQQLPKEQRTLLYESGLVRRVREQDVEIRAPIVFDLANEVKKRVHHVRVILQSNFSIRGINDSLKPAAVEVLNKIERAAALGNLKNLHVGVGTYLGESKINIRATALNKGQYIGELSQDLQGLVSVGGEVWIILWGWEEGNIFRSEFLPFPVIE